MSRKWLLAENYSRIVTSLHKLGVSEFKYRNSYLNTNRCFKLVSYFTQSGYYLENMLHNWKIWSTALFTYSFTQEFQIVKNIPN